MKRGSLIGLLLAGAVGVQAGLPALLVEEGAPRGALIAGESLRCGMSEITALRAAVDARRPEAADMVRRFVAEHPTSAYLPEAMALLTVAAYQTGDYALAARTGRELARAGLAPRSGRFVFAHAVSALQTGDLSEAEPLFASLRSSKEYGQAARFWLAYTAYAKGDLAAARSGFETAMRADKSDCDALSYLAQIDYAEADYASALRRAEEALGKGVRAEFRPELQRVAGESAYALGNYDAALPYLEDYLKSTGAPARTALYDLASILYAKAEYDRAADMFEQLTAEGEPDALTQSAALYLGQCRMRQDDPSAAAIAFQTAGRMDFDPKVTEAAMYDYLAAAERGGRIPFASSVTLMQQFAERFPASQFTPEIQTSLARAYLRQHEYAAALKSAKAINPQTSESRLLLCNVLYSYGLHSLRTGDAKQALSFLREAESLAGNDAEMRLGIAQWSATARYGLANSLMQCGKYADAAEQYALVAKDPAALTELRADALTRRADCMYLTRKPAAAIPLYKQAIQTNPGASGYPRLRLARMYALTGQNALEMSELNALLADASQQSYHPEATLQKGLALIEAGKDAEALATLESISSRWPQAPQNAEALLKSAILHRQLGHKENAENAYNQVINNFPKTPQAQAAHQDILTLTQQKDEEAKEAKAAQEALDIVISANQLIANGKAEEARKTLRTFIDSDTPYAHTLALAYIALADAEAALGHKSVARQYLTALRDNYPGDEPDIEQAIQSRLKQLK